MSFLIQDAAKGAQSAMLALYKANKQKVWCIAQCMLLDPAQASNATVAIFREMWREVRNGGIKTADEFTKVISSKAAELCSATLLQKNPRAFRIPFDKDFHLPAGYPVNLRPETELEYYLTNLPALQRLIFVLHTIGGWGALKIGRVLQWDSALVRTALNTQADNFEQLQQLSGRDYHDDFPQILQHFAKWEINAEIPEDTDRQIRANIRELSTEEGEQAKRNRIVLSCVGIFLCALAIWIALLPVIQNSRTGSADSKAETTADVDNDNPDGTTEAAQEDDNGLITPAPLDTNFEYYAELEIGDYDPIVFKLDPVSAPKTSAGFVHACEIGFYDMLTLYDLAEGNILSGGLSGDHGFLIEGEHIGNGYENTLSPTAGAIALAPIDENSTASRFVIFTEDRPDLAGIYPVFGHITEGMDVLKEIRDSLLVEESGAIKEENQPVIFSFMIEEIDTYVEYED